MLPEPVPAALMALIEDIHKLDPLSRDWRRKKAAKPTAIRATEKYEEMTMKSDARIHEEISRFVLEDERNKAELKYIQSRNALQRLRQEENGGLEDLARANAFTDKHFVSVTNFMLGHGHDPDGYTTPSVGGILGIGTRHVDRAFTDLVHMGILRQMSTDLRRYKLATDGERKIATRAIEYVMGLNSEEHE